MMNLNKHQIINAFSYQHQFSTIRLARRVIAMLNMGTNMQVNKAPLISVNFPHGDYRAG